MLRRRGHVPACARPAARARDPAPAKGRPLRGIVVRNEDGAVAIELYVVVEYGLNLAEVAATVRSRVAYEVERLTGLRVASVDVHIQAVKRTA